MAHNPSLPEEVGEDFNESLKGDAIGNTMYSEKWVLKTLMKFTEELPEYCGFDDPVELKENLETDLCLLWDMTTEQDVGKLLMQHSILDLLQEAVEASSAPRLTEIAVGILGNLACHLEAREEIGRRPYLVKLVLDLLANPDPPTLMETLRLVLTCAWDLRNGKLNSNWVENLIVNQDVCQSFSFILRSSTNEDLLCRCCEVLDMILYIWLDEKDCYMSKFYADSELISSLMEATKQLYGDKGEYLLLPQKVQMALDSCLSILYSFTYHQQGKKAICDCAEEIAIQVSVYLTQYLGEQGLKVLEKEDLENITSAVTVLEALHSAVFHKQSFHTILQVVSEIARKEKEKEDIYIKIEAESRPVESETKSAEQSAGSEKHEKENQDDGKKELKKLLDGMKECLYEYFVCLLEQKIDSKSELVVYLDQCQDRELVVFLESVKKRKDDLLKKLQHQLKDTKEYNKLKEILNDVIKS